MFGTIRKQVSNKVFELDIQTAKLKSEIGSIQRDHSRRLKDLETNQGRLTDRINVMLDAMVKMKDKIEEKTNIKEEPVPYAYCYKCNNTIRRIKEVEATVCPNCKHFHTVINNDMLKVLEERKQVANLTVTFLNEYEQWYRTTYFMAHTIPFKFKIGINKITPSNLEDLLEVLESLGFKVLVEYDNVYSGRFEYELRICN